MIRFSAVMLASYVICMAAVFGGMLFARQAALRAYGSRSAMREWEAWREDVRQRAPTEGVTKRSVPKSDQPPALVLMQDYFWACTAFAIVMCSALFLTTSIVIRGALQQTVVRDD